MFWRSKEAPAQAAAPEEQGGGHAALAAEPLDALADLLRVFGRHGFDVPERSAVLLRDLCEAWARHLLILAPRPGSTGGDETLVTIPPPGRDFSGALQFVTQQRSAEAAYVRRAFGDMREALWAFIRGINNVLGEENEADERVRQQLARLKTLAESGSTEALRREALEVSDRISSMLEERRARARAEAAALGERVAALGAQLEEAKREGATDALTKLHNRRVFEEAFPRTIDLCALVKQRACLLLVDADRFKAVNDSHGHATGDRVLCGIADALSRTFRRRDDLVARYGGEEFVALLRDTKIEDARSVATRLLATVRGLRFWTGSHEIGITVSAGLSELSPGESAASWFERTDKALYEAKQSGRDRVVEAAPPATAS